MSKFPSKELDQFTVRFPDGMRDRIKAAAQENNRSMNAEIIATLEEKYPEVVFTADEIVELLSDLYATASLEDKIDKVETINRILDHMNSDFRVSLGDEGIVLLPHSPRD